MARILVIDDDQPILELLRRILEREGHDVFEATNGNEGIRIAFQEPLDLVITDIVMPEKEGLETIKELKYEFPDLRILAISGGGPFNPDMFLEIAEKFGAMRSMTKPFTRQQLLDMVEELLG